MLRSRRDRFGFPAGLQGRRGWGQHRLDDEFDRIKSEGSGHVEEFRRREPQFGPPHRCIDDKHEPAFFKVGKSRVRGK